MTSEFQSLLEVLQKQRDLYIELHALMEGAHGSLREYRADEIDVYNKTIETLKLKSDALEKARQNIVKKIESRFDSELGEWSLSRIAELAPPKIGRNLQALREQLREITRHIALQNEQNFLVAQASLAAITNLGRLLHQVTAEPLTYQPPNGANRSAAAARGL